jgi:hypothetical protein
LQPAAQQPSSGKHSVTSDASQLAVQLAASPTSVLSWHPFGGSHVLGQFPSHSSSASTTPSPQIGAAGGAAALPALAVAPVTDCCAPPPVPAALLSPAAPASPLAALLPELILTAWFFEAVPPVLLSPVAIVGRPASSPSVPSPAEPVVEIQRSFIRSVPGGHFVLQAAVHNTITVRINSDDAARCNLANDSHLFIRAYRRTALSSQRRPIDLLLDAKSRRALSQRADRW